MSTQTILPTLLGSSCHQQRKVDIKKPSVPQDQAPDQATKCCDLKKPHSREEKLLLLPHNGIRFVMDELLDALRNMDSSLDWKWENLNIWYDEYFHLMVKQHHDAEENIYFPWIQAALAKVGMPAIKKAQHPAPIHELDVISKLIEEGVRADQSQKSSIRTQLCQMVENMVDKMNDHLAEQEQIIPRLMKKAGCTRAEQDAVMMETIQSLTFEGNRVALPAMVHALKLSSGSEKAASFVEKLPKPDRFLYSSSWAPDFQSRHCCLIRSVHKDEGHPGI
eukprot:gnl/MRDRNA2_/MRDRNA2_60727_c0_seq2.p1 gnl/MRDRNA2_/MRDRNA2_60727_c0~~gnl/MRDRNA2_/MRDRNA2_60727_c0_seq2.p1  ORF type:complete len:278 (-),score=57.73 gnl/MRDRNA2_/MRDRNA2_60727_c0_seq2:233-1066(-)